MDKKVILIILDGWGIPKAGEEWRSAIEQANVPFFREIAAKYPNSKLEACGRAVGLPVGQMGNSEVGHINLGAGRVVFQELEKITVSLENKSILETKAMSEAIAYAKENSKAFHLIGLASDGGVHSHIEHLKGLCTLISAAGVKDLKVHAFMDGRDCDPKSGKGFIEDLQAHLLKTGGKLASMIGRYYAMDRDTRWERVKQAYDLMVSSIADSQIEAEAATTAIQDSYDAGITDEFLKPIVITENGQPIGNIAAGDVVMCFNFRTDRGREISEVLTQRDFPELDMKKLDIHYVTMTSYDEKFKNVNVVFNKDNLTKTLGEVVADAGKKQIRIAETEKYPHVSFFFSGGRETPFEGESRILCPSPKDVATYDLKPQMASNEIGDAIAAELIKEEVDFVCLNFAAPDMVGHTGVIPAVITAVETVDLALKKVVETGLKHGYTSIVIADHGNADFMLNDDKSPNTQHSLNLVPCIIVDKEFKGEVKNGKLGDIAPTILKLMGIAQPVEMDGVALV